MTFKPGRQARSGFSLVEIMIALMLLLITTVVIGSGLVGALNLERQTEAEAGNAELAHWIRARHTEGIMPEPIQDELDERFEDALVTHSSVKAEDERRWDRWRLQASPDAPALILELIAQGQR